MHRLKKRRDYLKVARGDRTPRRGFLLQSTRRDAGAKAVVEDGPRFGFTVTKKIGNAVVRNRIRRRLREAIRLAGPDVAQAGCDYVLIGRREALAAPFPELRGEIDRAFRKIFDPRPGGDARSGSTTPGERPPRGKRRGRGANRSEPPAGGA